MNTAMKDFDFPKAELHCHLDGTYRLSTIIEMAKKRKIFLPSFDPVILSKKLCVLKQCRNLDEYLEIFKFTVPALAGEPENLKRLAREAVIDKAADGVRYLELRYAPHLMLTKGSELTLEDVVIAVNEGLKEGMDEVKANLQEEIVVRSILCTIIDCPEWSMEVAKLCKAFKSQGVVGIDVAGAGDKIGDLIMQHKKAFVFCKKNGINRTAHAGEKGNANEVAMAVDELKVQRVGHGYKVLEDEEIYKRCREQNIHFEVCPLSSFLTSSVDNDMTKHPAIRFMKDGVSFSINTDDPGVQQSTLIDDYQIASKSFLFSIQQLHSTNISALKSAFVDEQTKERLIKKFEEKYKSLMASLTIGTYL